MAETGEMSAVTGDADGHALVQALEEPLVQWVIVAGSVDVGRADGGECDSCLTQVALGVELALVTAIGVYVIALHVGHNGGFEIDSSR